MSISPFVQTRILQDSEEAIEALTVVFEEDLLGLPFEVKENGTIVCGGYKFQYVRTTLTPKRLKNGSFIQIKEFLFNRNDSHDVLLSPEEWAVELIREALRKTFY